MCKNSAFTVYVLQIKSFLVYPGLILALFLCTVLSAFASVCIEIQFSFKKKLSSEHGCIVLSLSAFNQFPFLFFVVLSFYALSLSFLKTLTAAAKSVLFSLSLSLSPFSISLLLLFLSEASLNKPNQYS
jgi:hypothetical protein